MRSEKSCTRLSCALFVLTQEYFIRNRNNSLRGTDAIGCSSYLHYGYIYYCPVYIITKGIINVGKTTIFDNTLILNVRK